MAFRADISASHKQELPLSAGHRAWGFSCSFFFQLPTSVQRQGFLNSRLPLLQQQNGARENQTNPVDTEQQLLSYIIDKIDYWQFWWIISRLIKQQALFPVEAKKGSNFCLRFIIFIDSKCRKIHTLMTSNLLVANGSENTLYPLSPSVRHHPHLGGHFFCLHLQCGQWLWLACLLLLLSPSLLSFRRKRERNGAGRARA